MKIFKNRLILGAVSFALLVPLQACGSSSDDSSLGTNNGSNINLNSANGSSTSLVSVSIPSIPNISAPITSQPSVSEDELYGSVNLEGATGIITLKHTTAEFTGSNVVIKSNPTYGVIVEIEKSGTYIVQGTLEQGFIAVSKKELSVTIILNGVNIYCANYAPIVCTKKSDVTVELATGSTNYLTDNGTYALDYDVDHEPNATLYIRKDIEIRGTGKLIVNSNNNNGIGSKANLRISSGDISVNAVNNALKGNDSVIITGGTFSLVSKSDGIKSDNIEDPSLGYIDISGGSFAIAAVNDAIQSTTYLTIANAIITTKAGGGSSVSATADSAKGLKATTLLTIESGTINIDANDDAIHSDKDLIINDGVIIIASGDDGIHANENLTINGGTIEITKSYEGLEATNINLVGGNVNLIASDDGINISGGNDGSGNTNPGRPGGQTQAISGKLTITGGYHCINATGDGLDSNGSIDMSGGTVIVHGPTAEMDAPIDFDGTFSMTGGTLIALGSSGMAQQPNGSSAVATAQYSLLVKFTTAVASGSLINLKSEAGNEIVTVKCRKSIKSIVICTPTLATGKYVLSSGGTYSVNPDTYGLCTGGTYSGGTVVKNITISKIATSA